MHFGKRSNGLDKGPLKHDSKVGPRIQHFISYFYLFRFP